ncbi:STAS domain-containing protein [Streptomyces tauricus]|uniref:STAS domain-containing protein n=1 Tax=Streptomyces tauricus TaxID=68274 RepID=UPI0033B1D141
MPSPQSPSRDETTDAEPVGCCSPKVEWEPPEELSAPRLSVRKGAAERIPARLELIVVGELDSNTAVSLREYVAVVAARSTCRLLVLDLSEVTCCDSAGFSKLLGIRETLALAGIKVTFSQASTVVRAAADRVGLMAHLVTWGGS